MVTSFGIEEEFLLLDPVTLTPVEHGAQAVADLSGDGDAGTVTREFLGSQVEYSTPVCETMEDAREALRGFRRRLGQWAVDAGVIAAGTGTPPAVHPRASVSPGERYEQISDEVTTLADDHQICGLHVHVGVDREAGIRAVNALRGWLPALLALSGNSPLWNGRDTGYGSWRAIHSRRWTTYGIPPVFRDAEDYDAAVVALVGIGATSDTRSLNWNVRLSAVYPTLEVRVCDAQLDAERSVALAAVIRALVEATADSGRDSGRYSGVGAGGGAEAGATQNRTLEDAALWHAARHGLDDTLVHPGTGRLAPAVEVLTSLHDLIAPHLHGDEAHAVKDLLAQRRAGAARQREAHRAGLPALASLYRETLVR